LWRQGRAQVNLKRAIPALFLILLGVCVYSGASLNSIVIEPFSVPKRYEDAGLTPEVMSRLIADALVDLEEQAHSGMRKDRLALSSDPSPFPDIEVPGTKFGLRTLVEATLQIFRRDPTHVRGAILLPITSAATTSGAETAASEVEINLRIVRGRDSDLSLKTRGPAADPHGIGQKTAEAILRQINPYLLGAYRAQTKDWDGALSIAKEIISDPRKDKRELAKAYLLWGGGLGNQGKYAEAIPFFEKATTLDPKFALAYYNWGVSLAEQGNYTEAIRLYEKATILDPKDAAAYYNWGVSLMKQGKNTEAITFYEKATALDPKLAIAYSNWGAALAKKGKNAEAIPLYEKAATLDPKLPIAYNNLGIVRADQSKYAEAIALYEKAATLDPNDAAAYYNWGNALAKQGKNAEAIPFYEKAATLDPKDADVYSNWGLALAKQGKNAEAIALYEKATALNPNLPLAYYNWCNALDALGKHAEAEEKRRWALALDQSK
jgi:tetratricopeptide (TPR) repeat protein